MPEEDMKLEFGEIKTPTVTDAAMQTLDVLVGVVNVLEKMWEANTEATYAIQGQERK